MYNNKLAVALKSNGKVLREFKDEVYVPFGDEYSIFIKNMNSVRALVHISVDGVDVGDGTKFVVDPNDDIDIERFIKNGNYDQGNRLKFIERTGKIEDHRGIGIEDGLVRVEFNFEKVTPIYYPPYVSPRTGRRWNDNNPSDNIFYGSSGTGRGMINQTFTTSAGSAQPNVSNSGGSIQSSVNVNHVTFDSMDVTDTEIKSEVENDAGITVDGSVSNQQFQFASSFAIEAETHVIVLKILGETEDNVQVRKPVTVKTKTKCVTCGCSNKATAKFCCECGTACSCV